MITAYECSDIVHIMKMYRLTLIDSDSAHLHFKGQIKDSDYQITILVVEDSPTIIIKENAVTVFNDTMKSIDDLKIFLEERLYLYLGKTID